MRLMTLNIPQHEIIKANAVLALKREKCSFGLESRLVNIISKVL